MESEVKQDQNMEQNRDSKEQNKQNAKQGRSQENDRQSDNQKESNRTGQEQASELTPGENDEKHSRDDRRDMKNVKGKWNRNFTKTLTNVSQ